MMRKSALPGEIPRKQLRQQKSQHNLAADGEDSKAQRQADRMQKITVKDQTAEIVQPVEEQAVFGCKDIPLVEADKQHIQEWRKAKNQQNNQCRAEQKPASAGIAHGNLLL